MTSTKMKYNEPIGPGSSTDITIEIMSFMADVVNIRVAVDHKSTISKDSHEEIGFHLNRNQLLEFGNYLITAAKCIEVKDK